MAWRPQAIRSPGRRSPARHAVRTTRSVRRTGSLGTWMPPCRGRVRRSTRSNRCRTIRPSCCPTHPSRSRPRRSNRRPTIPVVTPAACPSPPDLRSGTPASSPRCARRQHVRRGFPRRPRVPGGPAARGQGSDDLRLAHPAAGSTVAPGRRREAAVPARQDGAQQGGRRRRAPDGGSAVGVAAPAVAARGAGVLTASRSPAARVGRPPPGGPRLLVVEDDPTIAEPLIGCRERADVPDPTGPRFDSRLRQRRRRPPRVAAASGCHLGGGATEARYLWRSGRVLRP